jgi:hypothetical protein
MIPDGVSLTSMLSRIERTNGTFVNKHSHGAGGGLTVIGESVDADRIFIANGGVNGGWRDHFHRLHG